MSRYLQLKYSLLKKVSFSGGRAWESRLVFGGMYVERIKKVVHKEQEYRVIEEVKEDLQEGYVFCCCRNILEMYHATFLFFLTYQP